ncbi:MAG: cell division ATP-binding protein FtsE [Candidatus Aquicultorales bacterium]
MITMQKVSMVYNGAHRPALKDIDVQIEKGEFVFLVGPSGCGKSTYIRLLLRELLPTEGKIFVAGYDVAELRSWRIPLLRRNIGCVFQDFKLLPNKTAFENVAFALEVIGRPARIVKQQVPEVLDLVGLKEKANRYPDEMSGGEQQRVSIARAFVNRPPILLADEPTGNLDPGTSSGIMSLLDKINQTGTTVLVATHDRDMVDSMRKRVIALEEGHLVRDQLRGVYGYEEILD